MKILSEVIKDIVAGCLCRVLNVMAAVVVSLTCAVGLYGSWNIERATAQAHCAAKAGLHACAIEAIEQV